MIAVVHELYSAAMPPEACDTEAFIAMAEWNPEDEALLASFANDRTTTEALAPDQNETDYEARRIRDRALVAGMTDSDQSVVQEKFGEMYGLYHKKVLAYLNRVNSGNWHDNEDFTAQAFEKALRYFNRNAENNVDNLSSWLCRIAMRNVLDHKRLRSYKSTVLADKMPEPDVRVTADSHFTDVVEMRNDLVVTLQQLPEAQCKAVVALYIHGMSTAEAADYLGLNERTVRTQAFRGRAAAKKILQAQMGSATT